MAAPTSGHPPRPPSSPRSGWFGTVPVLAGACASGCAVMIVEMTAVRAVQPFFGSTTYVWTNAIAVVLAALALGYALGGRLADRRPSARLFFVLMGVGGLLVAVSAFLVTPVSRLFLQEGVDLEGIVSVLLWGSLGTALLLFAPPILLLGMTAPLAIRLVAGLGVGRAAGLVFALSTLGSIVGTYLPTLVLVPHLGSRGSILVAGGMLLVVAGLGLLLTPSSRGRPAAAATLLAGAAALAGGIAGGLAPARPAPPLVGGVATVLAERESPYQYLTVRDDVYGARRARVLTINEGVYSFHALDVPGAVLTGSRYYDAYSVLPFLLERPPGSTFSACVIGMACGVNARQWHDLFSQVHDVHVDGAEIDPEVVRLGRRYFHLPSEDETWLRLWTLDGRALLEALPSSTRYHAIVVDAFSNELYVPFHLATREFFSLCEDRLEDRGMLAMNVYARGAHAANLRAIENTMAVVFGSVLRVPHYETGGFLLLAQRGAAAIDLDRLDRATIQARYGASTESPPLSEVAGWEELLDLADEIRASGASAATVVPTAGVRVLTDDDAPLEWLTDRFLRGLEATTRREDPRRRDELQALRSRQNALLLGVVALWVVGLGLGPLLRRLRA